MRHLILATAFLSIFTISDTKGTEALECADPDWAGRSICNQSEMNNKNLIFCKEKNLTANQTEKCLFDVEEMLLKNSRKPPKYPVKIYSAKTYFDPISAKELRVFWSAENKKSLKIHHVQPKQSPRLIYSIPSERIISFKHSLIDMSDNAGEAAMKINISTITSPISMVGRGLSYKISEHYKWELSFLDEFGREIKQELYPVSSVPVAHRFYTFLPDLTGLKSGERKSFNTIRRMVSSGIQDFEKKLNDDFKKISITERKYLHTCEKPDEINYPLTVKRFNQEKRQLEALRRQLGLGVSQIGYKCRLNFLIYLKGNLSKLLTEASKHSSRNE